MSRRIIKAAPGLILALAVAGGLFALGRATVDRDAARADGYRAGQSAGQSDGYFAGLRVGEARGRQEGRAQQAEASAPNGSGKSVADAFNAGYTAGTNDAFAGYDGGWALSAPYVVTLQPGDGRIVYRISSRTALERNVNYFLCPNGRELCQEPRR